MQHRRAFTLIELMLVIGITLLLISLLLPTISSVRKTARTTICGSRLNQLNVASSAYAIDYRESIFSLSWYARMSNPPTTETDLLQLVSSGFSDTFAASAQAIALFRKHDNGDSLTLPAFSWFPYDHYNALVIADYLQGNVPSDAAICPEDRARLTWRNKDTFQSLLPELETADSSPAYRYRFGTTFSQTYAAFSLESGPSVSVGTVPHYIYTRPPFPKTMGIRRLMEVSFPSSKVLLFDNQDRHSSRTQMWYAEARAAQPLLMFDGSVAMRATQDANPGWHPHFPNSMTAPGTNKFSNAIFSSVLRIRYEPRRVLGEAYRVKADGWHAPFYKYTRGGLKGVDFGTPDIDTTNWREP